VSKTKIAIAAVAAVIVVIILIRVFIRDDDSEIRLMLDGMATAAETRNTPEFIKHFSMDYKDSHGNTYFVIQQFAQITFSQVEELKVEFKKVNISVAGKSAYVTLEVVTRAKSKGRISHPFGSEERPELPRLTLKRERGNWKIFKVEGVERGGYFDDF
jgi:hypothetical protein